MENPGFEAIKSVISAIPAGQVLSYGEVAALAGRPGGQRMVVWVLKAWGQKLPWHRVVRRGPRIAIKDPDGALLQRRLLESEGWAVDSGGRLSKPMASTDEDDRWPSDEWKDWNTM